MRTVSEFELDPSSADEEITEKQEQDIYSDNSQDSQLEKPQSLEINVEIPNIHCNLGNELFLAKLPNVLSVESRRFDPAFYEDESEEKTIDGSSRLKLKVENMIRWRYKVDQKGNPLIDQQTGNPLRESNTRIVRWSDGSMTLHLGGEVFDMKNVNIETEYNHLFLRQGTGLQGQAVIEQKLLFRPISIDSVTHRKMAMSVAATQFSKRQRIKFISTVDENPEVNRIELSKKEDEKNRAAAKLENSQRRSRNRLLPTRDVTFSMLEGADDYGNMNRRKTSKRRVEDYDEDDSDSSGFGHRTVKRRVLSSDDD